MVEGGSVSSNYMYKKVREIRTVDEEEAANVLLAEGWTLLEVMMHRGGQTVSYVLGRRFLTEEEETASE
jgi:hypothetical protein